MKKYFSYTSTDNDREFAQKPCKVIVNNIQYTSFTNTWPLALTTEDAGEIELLDTAKTPYPDVSKWLVIDEPERKINFPKIFAMAKSHGYILSKRYILNPRLSYLFEYDDAYYNLALLDITYRIIDNGEPALVYHLDGSKNPITIKTSIGICMILPCAVSCDDPRLGTNQIISFDQSFA